MVEILEEKIKVYYIEIRKTGSEKVCFVNRINRRMFGLDYKKATLFKFRVGETK